MILVDTSVWVDHLRGGDAVLKDLLESGEVVTHPFVIGELALGNLRHEDRILGSMRDLPQAAVANDEEVLRFISQHALGGRGIGYVDAHLLAATRLTPGSRLWTRDKRLLGVAQGLSIAAHPSH